MSTNILDESFDKTVTDHMRDAYIPGVSMMIQHEGKTSFKSYGTAYNNEPVTSKIRFPLCSISKHFIVLALLRLLDEKGLDVDTPVSEVLPKFKLNNTGVITFGHMLSHTTGLETDNGIWSDVIDTNQDFYDYFAKIPCTYPPGEKFYYANPMYDLCVPAIELLSETFFGPLGMASTSFTAQGGEDVAEGHIGKAVPVPFGPGMGFQGVDHTVAWKGAGSIISSAEDMAKWMIYLPTDPFFHQLVTPRVLAHDNARPANCIIDPGEQYGLGMFIGSYRGVKYYEHWAAIAGFSGLMTIIPELDLSVVSFANSWEGREMGSVITASIINRMKGWDEGSAVDVLKKEMYRRQARNSADFPAVQVTTDQPIIGTFHGRGIGRLVFSDNSNITERPACESLPWLCWMFSPVKPFITHLGQGKYAGCLQMELAGKVRYGYPFRFEKRDEGLWVEEFTYDKGFMLVEE